MLFDMTWSVAIAEFFPTLVGLFIVGITNKRNFALFSFARNLKH